MNVLRAPRRRVVGASFSVGTRSEIEVPVLHELAGGTLPRQPSAIVGFNVEIPVPSDVREVRLHGAGLAPATGYFDHDLRYAARGPRNVCQLIVREPNTGTASTEADRVE